MKTALLLVDHGSRRQASNDLLRELASELRQALPDTLVTFAHMEIAAPDIEQAFRECAAQGAQRIVVHPYFLGPGNHSRNDIPRLVAEVAKSFPGIEVRITEVLGPHPKLAEIVIERLQQSLAQPPSALRKSPSE